MTNSSPNDRPLSNTVRWFTGYDDRCAERGLRRWSATWTTRTPNIFSTANFRSFTGIKPVDFAVPSVNQYSRRRRRRWRLTRPRTEGTSGDDNIRTTSYLLRPFRGSLQCSASAKIVYGHLSVAVKFRKQRRRRTRISYYAAVRPLFSE